MNLSTLISRLFANHRSNDKGCWLVGNPESPRRYWCVIYDGKHRNAHQASWEFHRGPIPTGLCVLHRCDEPRCINPEHLFLGTMADNMHDRDAKGRNGTIGENAHKAKLTTSDVVSIREADPKSARYLAKFYGVTGATILRVIRGDTWRHIPLPCQDRKAA